MRFYTACVQRHLLLAGVGSLLAGFLASLGIYTIGVSFTASMLRGQLIAGDPDVNAQYPTTLGIMQDTMHNADVMVSPLWWLGVITLGFFLSFGVFIFVRKSVE